MKYLLVFLLLIDPVNEIDKIARTNSLKKEAKEAFQSGKYEEAIKKYHFLQDSMGVDDDRIKMNLANAYYQHRDTSSAVHYYNILRDSDNPQLASRAYQQLGVIKNKQKEQQEALKNFKQALRKDPNNEEARYNYELLKKLLKEQEEQQKDQQQQNQEQEKDQEQEQKKDQQQQQDQEQDQKNEEQQKQDQEKKDQEGKESEDQQKEDQQKEDQQKEDQKKDGEEQEKKNEGKPEDPSDEKNKDQQKKDDMNISPDKLKEMKISEEKAKMILEAMKNQEIQYIQQNRRKSEKRPPSGKPDW